MQVCAPGISGASHFGNHLAPTDVVSGVHQQLAGVGVEGRQASAMIDQDGVSILSISSGLYDRAWPSRPDSLSELPVDVDALVMSVLASGTECRRDSSP
jgi:hypothetical protein